MAFSSPDFDLNQIKFSSMAFTSPDFDLIQIKFSSMAFTSPDFDLIQIKFSSKYYKNTLSKESGKKTASIKPYSFS